MFTAISLPRFSTNGGGYSFPLGRVTGRGREVIVNVYIYIYICICIFLYIYFSSTFSSIFIFIHFLVHQRRIIKFFCQNTLKIITFTCEIYRKYIYRKSKNIYRMEYISFYTLLPFNKQKHKLDISTTHQYIFFTNARTHVMNLLSLLKLF